MTIATCHITGGDQQPDFVLFVISSYSVSRGRVDQLRATVRDHVALPADLIRLDTSGPDLLTALDAQVAQGHRIIRVQPLGLPLSDSLLNWLPGVLAHWRQSRTGAAEVLLGSDQVMQQAGWAEFLKAMLAEPAAAIDDDTVPALGKPGWQAVPAFRFHLLVCTGPRCQIHGSNPLLQQLQDSCRRHGVYRDCLITRTGCMSPCNQGPLVAVYPKGSWYRLAETQAVDDFVREVLVEGEHCARLRIHQTAAPNPDAG